MVHELPQRKKITYAAVNGQTGKVAADLPLSPVKILVTALVISAFIFGLLMVIMHFLPTLPSATTLGICTMLGFSGMYVLQHCYLKTIGAALHQTEMTKNLSFGFIVQSIVAVAGIILLTTDGTYAQSRALLGFILTIPSLFILVLHYFLQQTLLTGKIRKIKLTGVSMQSNGILVEAKKFNRINALIRLLLFLTLAAFISFVIKNDQSNAFYYGMAAIGAAELFLLTLMHILFQSHIAKRRLPQFNKKGAAYDTI